LREADVKGRVGLGVVDVDRRWAGLLVVVAKFFVKESGRLAGIWFRAKPALYFPVEVAHPPTFFPA
jgi:hypothetical protein